MDSTSGALIGASTLILVSFIGWFSQRATRESRFLIRVKQFGSAYVLVPDSPEKVLLKEHYLSLVRELNTELDQKQNRTLINIVTVSTSIVGVVVVVFLVRIFGSNTVTWLSLGLGFVIGLIIGGVNFAATWFINRRASATAFDQRAKKFVSGEL